MHVDRLATYMHGGPHSRSQTTFSPTALINWTLQALARAADAYNFQSISAGRKVVQLHETTRFALGPGINYLWPGGAKVGPDYSSNITASREQ